MLLNYFKIAWRNLARNKAFSIIKIFGLGIGLTVCMLIFLYTKDEVSYDQFHANKALLYRVVQNWQFGKDPKMYIGTTNAVLGEAFAREIPGVQECIRVNGYPVTVKKDNETFTEYPLCVDDNFFTAFSFSLLKGHAQTALSDRHAIVLSAATAQKYFGSTDVIGKTMEIKMNEAFETFIVTAVAGNAPQNSTLKGDMYLPYDYFEQYNSNRGWFGGSVNTFLLLSPLAAVKPVEEKMQALFDKNISTDLKKAEQEQGTSLKIQLQLQPLTSIHLSTEAGPDNGMADGSKPVYSYILSSIAFFILLIACINFINLAIAQSVKRSKEIGIRKVVGSTRKQLVWQFMVESFLVSSLSFLIGLALTILVLPYFNELAGKKLSLTYLSDGYLYAGYFLLLLATSFVAGFYPSLVLSAFQPVKALYNRKKLLGKNLLTRGLIVLQFSLAIFLLIGTIAINAQLNFISNADLGYDSKNLVRLDIPVRHSSNALPALFKKELSGHPSITNIAAKNHGRSETTVTTGKKNITVNNNRIDEDYFSTFEIPVIAGRNFSPDFPSDTLTAAIVNETFIKNAGWDRQEAIGKIVRFAHRKEKTLTIIGVIRDYHFASLKEAISPEIFTMDPNFDYGQIWVKISPGNIPQSLDLLQTTYKKLIPWFPYSYQLMEDINAKKYEGEAKWKQIISIASVLFTIISAIGLLGLLSLSIERRTKEIGIRKVLGSAVSAIVVLITKEFVGLIVLAFVIAAPAGYYFVHTWLQNFAYRTDISWWMFVLAGVSVISIALFILSFQAIKAALVNPVKSLKTE